MALGHGDSLTPDEHRKAAVAEHKKRVVRMAEELDNMIKLVTFTREAVENAVFSGLGYKQQGMTEKDLKAVKDLASTWNSVVDAKIRFDKAQKSLADEMTKEQEWDAVVSYIKALEPFDRGNLLNKIRKWMRNKGEPVDGFTDPNGAGDGPVPGI